MKKRRKPDLSFEPDPKYVPSKDFDVADFRLIETLNMERMKAFGMVKPKLVNWNSGKSRVLRFGRKK